MELFGTAGIRGPVEEVTPELALSVGRAAAADGTEFVVGRDGRGTGPALAAAVEAGLESGGATVRRVEQAPTPALAFASRGRRGVAITASHNPPADNGIKLFADGREYDRDAERLIEERVESGTESVAWDAWGDSTAEPVLADYRDAVVAYARGIADRVGGKTASRSPLDGLDVAVDCGNGMAGLATPQVLRALGAGVVALNANVDGRFPARESKPTPESLSDLRAFVAEGDADLGVGHDGDADRTVFVDADGAVVHEDTVVAILAEHYARASDAGDPVVVTTPNASARIDDRVAAAGGRTERVGLGALHEGIAGARAAGGADTAVAFAAEPWKHIHPDLGGWIDGVASAAAFAVLVAAEGLDALREPVAERPYRKGSVPCPGERKAAAMERLGGTLPEEFPAAAVSRDHGVRLSFSDDSWVLVRPSGTEPRVRVYAEGDDADALLERVVGAVERAVEEAG